MTKSRHDTLLQALNQAKAETKKGLNDVFAARLERIGGYIRINDLSPIEANELLTQEAEKLRNECNEINA